MELFVVIATIAILAATLLPALAASKDRGMRAECASNLRQLCAATFIYAADSNDFMPPLKWRDSNLWYPYLMFRYTPVNVPVDGVNSVFWDGPENLGALWSQKVATDGRTYYCPGNQRANDAFTFEFYNVKKAWPWGVDPAASNPEYVRSGYSYYPQSRRTQLYNTAMGKRAVPIWPDYTTSPEPFRSWNCVPPFKRSEIDQTKSIVVDLMFDPNRFTHISGNTLLGINAGFGDGHVAWQGVNQVKDGFDPNEWMEIGQASGGDLRFVMSCWQP
jgi:prepilin-type processing-associated H-X9-DG protein